MATNTTISIPTALLTTTFINIALQSFFTGTCFLYLIQAVGLYLRKRNFITLANIVQLCFYMARQLTVVLFLIFPSSALNCLGRVYAGGITFSALIVTIWVIQLIKFRSLYQTPWLRHVMLGIVILGTAGTFPYVKTTTKTDDYGFCSVKFDPTLQAIQVITDVSVHMTLSGLFIFAIGAYLRKSSKSSYWESHSKLYFIITHELRASFLDTLAQCFKLYFSIGGLPSSDTVFFSHIVDWMKPTAAHWFVMEVSTKTSEVKSTGSKGSKGGSRGGQEGGGSNHYANTHANPSTQSFTTSSTYFMDVLPPTTKMASQVSSTMPTTYQSNYPRPGGNNIASVGVAGPNTFNDVAGQPMPHNGETNSEYYDHYRVFGKSNYRGY